MKGHVEIAQWLIEQGADFEVVDFQNSTALIWAVQAGSLAIVEALVEAGANRFDDAPVEQTRVWNKRLDQALREARKTNDSFRKSEQSEAAVAYLEEVISHRPEVEPAKKMTKAEWMAKALEEDIAKVKTKC